MSGEDARGRGVLSTADRAFLRGERELSSVQAERNARARIRERIYSGLQDFEVLLSHLEERDLELVFEKRVDADGTTGFDALVSTLALLYRGVARTDLDFETVLREGINLAEAENDRAATVEFDLTFHALDADQLREKLASGESLSLTEIAYLYESTAVSRDELAQYFDDARAPELDDGRVQSKVTEY